MTSTASEVYPVKCQEGSPVLRGLTKVKLPRRSRALPDLYKFDGIHPSHQVKLPTSSTYVYLVDSSHEGKEVFDRISDAQKVPSGPIAGVYGLISLLLLLTSLCRTCRSSRIVARGCPSCASN